jgi:hypothetical protein
VTGAACRSVEALLDQGHRDARLPEALSAHIESCRSCRRLWTWFSGDGSGPLPDATIARLQSVLPSTLPVDPLAALSKRILGFVLIVAGVWLVYGLIFGLGAFGRMSATQSIAAAGGLICAGLIASASLARQMEPAAPMPVPPLRLMILLTGAYAAVTAGVFPWTAASRGFSAGLLCWTGGVVLSAPAAVLSRLMVRRSVVLVPGVIGATAGTLAAMTGLAVLQFACLWIDAAHRLAHVAVLPAGTALGYVICRLATSRVAARRANVNKSA